jgi:hypothetical protein
LKKLRFEKILEDYGFKFNSFGFNEKLIAAILLLHQELVLIRKLLEEEKGDKILSTDPKNNI